MPAEKPIVAKSGNHGKHKMGQKKTALHPHEMPPTEEKWAEKMKAAMHKGMPPTKRKMKPRMKKQTQ